MPPRGNDATQLVASMSLVAFRASLCSGALWYKLRVGVKKIHTGRISTGNLSAFLLLHIWNKPIGNLSACLLLHIWNKRIGNLSASALCDSGFPITLRVAAGGFPMMI